MNKQNIILLLLLLYSNIFLGQIGRKSVFGKVVECNTKEPISNYKVKLIGEDGSATSTLTDSSGNYFFESTSIKKNLTYIISLGIMPKYWCITPEGSKYRFDTNSDISNFRLEKDLCLDKTY